MRMMISASGVAKGIGMMGRLFIMKAPKPPEAL